MADLEINCKGFTSLAAKLRAVLEDETDKLAKDLAKDYAELSRKNSPAGDTLKGTSGTLRNSWSYSTEKLGQHGRVAVIKNDCGYAPYVEHGHRVVVHGKETGKYVKGEFMAYRARKKIKAGMRKRYSEMAERVQRRMGT